MKEVNDTNLKREVIRVLKTYILQFIYKDGNGWAFVNAYSVSQAEKVFKNQTVYEGAKVTNIKETKYYGENMQLVFEGAVTTLAITTDGSCSGNNGGGNVPIPEVDYEAIFNELISHYDFTDIVSAVVDSKLNGLNIEELLNLNLDNYYTREEVGAAVTQIINLRLQNYVTATQVSNAISTAIGNLDIPSLEGYVTNSQLQTAISGVKGFKSISYSNGTLTIVTSDNVSHTVNISVNEGGGTSPTTIPVTSIGSGPMLEENCTGSQVSAQEVAVEQPDVMFQWIQNEVVDGVTIKKLWWHTGSGVFIDALGYTLDTSQAQS